MNKYQEALDRMKNHIVGVPILKWYYAKDATLLQELVDRATPIKVNRVICKTQISEYSTRIEHKAYCPICNTRILIEGNCCSNNDCRQALDWSRDDNHHR